MKIRIKKTNNWLSEAGYTRQEEGDIYAALLQDVINNPGWYLDNLDYLPTYRVSWVNYKSTNVTKPLEFVLIYPSKEKDL